MPQQLIVEGSDAIVIANICKKRRLPAPQGYSNEQKFKDEFVVAAGGYDKALIAFSEALNNSAINRLGLVIDADEEGAARRLETIKNILAAKFLDIDLSNFILASDGMIINAHGSLIVGVWIMPNNDNNGYLEHFVAQMAPHEDQLWIHTNSIVQNLTEQSFCRFSSIRKQKALVHTWLAWQQEPGKPMGVGIEAGYLDAHSISVDAFVNWMRQVFILGN